MDNRIDSSRATCYSDWSNFFEVRKYNINNKLILLTIILKILGEDITWPPKWVELEEPSEKDYKEWHKSRLVHLIL